MRALQVRLLPESLERLPMPCPCRHSLCIISVTCDHPPAYHLLTPASASTSCMAVSMNDNILEETAQDDQCQAQNVAAMQEVEGLAGRTVSPADITLLFRSPGNHVHGCMQGKLRIGLGDETVRVALAHAQSLHRHGADNADGSLANRLETAVQAVKQAYSQCPSYDALIPALLQYPIEVLRPAFSLPNRESRVRVANSQEHVFWENGFVHVTGLARNVLTRTCIF